MSQVDNLFDNLSEEDISAYTANPENEGHIVVGSDRFITVPPELKRIAVQYDHNIETVTFDCIRYWDEWDLSTMTVYINYMRADNTLGMYKATDVVVDEENPDIMHFNWTLSRNATAVKGTLSFLICIKKGDGEGNETNHWNSELCSDMTVSAGLECEETIEDLYPDVITSMLLRLDRLTDNSEVILENCEKATEDCTKLIAESTEILKNCEKATQDSVNLTQLVENKLEAGEFKGEKGDQGDKGDQGIQGERGERGPSGDGLGHETDEGGEIFNLYDDTEINLGILGKQTIPKNVASGLYSHAEGASTTAGGQGSHAEGAGSLAVGQASHAEGRGASFTVKVSAINDNVVTVKSNNSSATLRIQELESIDKNTVVWYETNATNHSGEFYYVTAVELVKTIGITSGCKMTLDRTPSFDTTDINLTIFVGSALSWFSHTEGNYCNTVDIEATNLYDGESSKRQRQHAEGSRTLAIGYGAHSEGEYSLALGGRTHAEGQTTKAVGDASHSEGYLTSATGYASHAEGGNNNAAGEYSHAEGLNTKSTGIRSHSEGEQTTASGVDSHAEGYYNTASGYAAHAEGGGNSAIGEYSHAEGRHTKAEGKHSHVEGNSTQATGQYSHAEGLNTIAAGNASHAEGNYTRANGSNSHASGEATTAGYTAQFVVGKHNNNKADTLFEVGNGTAWNATSNAFESYKDGHAEVQSQTKADGTIPDNAVVIYKTLKNLIAFGTLDPTKDTLPAEQQNCLFYVKVSE